MTRAWGRYFTVGPPYNPDQPRLQRRKDIPDAWILETAIDLARTHPALIAICADGRLSAALEAIPIAVFKTAAEVLDLIESPIPEPIPPAPAAETPKAPETAAAEAASTLTPSEQLADLLDQAQLASRLLDIKIAGFVSYLSRPTKAQLIDLLKRSGLSDELISNGIERLVLSGVIRDTGNHYLPVDRKIGDLAAGAVESDIIKLLGAGVSNGH